MKAARVHNSRLIQCYRWTRTCVHVLEGVATTVFVFPLTSATTRRSLIKRWSARLLRILAVESRVDGVLVSQSGNVLMVANHISWLDIFVLNAEHPVRFVAKSELTQWPVLSQMIRGAGTVFIERARRHDTHRVNAQMAAVLAGGDVVAIFPEGTTTDGRDLLPFKSSLLQPIVEAKGHVQPVAIRYCTHDGEHSMATAWVGDTTFAGSFWSICGARALVVTLSACPPLPAHAAHRRELARAAEASIRSALASRGCATAPGTPGDRQVATP